MIQSTPIKSRAGLILTLSTLFVLSITACRLLAHRTEDKKPEAKEAVEKYLKSHQAAWNNGNLGEFVSGYLSETEPGLFTGEADIKARKNTVQRYRQEFALFGKDHGKLLYTDIEVAVLTDDRALVRGAWKLAYESHGNRSGQFSMVVQNLRGDWRIVHELRSCDKEFDPKEVEVGVRRILFEQQDAWNEGQLEKFMEGYWKSDDMTFYSGGDIKRGWKNTLDRYRARYQSEGKEMGKLRFHDLELDPIDSENALARGHWELTMKDGKKPAGLFTLRLRRLAEGWRIVHDHTSVAAEK